jgi:pimeloyl-ACP methyl ester carboxylesterase
MTEQQMIQTDVGALAVRVRGTGRPAVLWHSLFMDERSWERVEPELAADHQLILITGPGHGASSDPGRRYTMEECAEAAATVLDTLGIDEPVDWVGNAWGGHVGIVFAATRPARCRTLVTLGTPAQAYAGRERLETALLLVLYRLFGPMRVIRDGVVDTMLSPRSRAEDPAAVTMVRNCLEDADRAKLGNAVASISLRRPDLWPFLARVSAPTLFITGTDHSGWTPDQATAAAELLSDGSVAVVPDTAYLTPLEAPGETVRLLRQFWATHTAPARSH